MAKPPSLAVSVNREKLFTEVLRYYVLQEVRQSAQSTDLLLRGAALHLHAASRVIKQSALTAQAH